MSFEHIEESVEDIEEAKTFEELPYTRDFGFISQEQVHIILKENSEYWRLPTIAELSVLYKQNKLKFFKSKQYWAYGAIDRNLTQELKEFKIGLFGSSWLFAGEDVESKKSLVLFKKGTNIDRVEEEIKNIEENYPF